MPPVYQDFSINQYADATLQAQQLGSGYNLSGWTMRCMVQRYFGGSSGLLTAWTASGFNGSSGVGASGLTLVDCLNGNVNIQVPSVFSSGIELGNYALTLERMDSGSRSTLLEGWLTVNPAAEV